MKRSRSNVSISTEKSGKIGARSCRAALLFTFGVRSKPDYEEMIEDLQDKKDTAHERSHDEEDKVTDEKLKKIEGLYRQRVAATKNVMNKCNGESNTALVRVV